MNFFKTTAASAAIVLIGSTAYADCGLSGGNVNILGNEFGAIQALVAGAKECANGSVTVESNLTTEHRDIQVAAMTANPAQYTAAIVANSSIVPLLNEGLVRPLDDLIAKHGAGIKKNQMISIDGKVMAIAFMANAQHLFVRQDILDQAGVAVPTSYEEVVTAGQAIKDAGIMEHPFAMNSKTGWNLGEEFVNMYIGTGADFFKPGTAEPAINNESGVGKQATLPSVSFGDHAQQACWTMKGQTKRLSRIRFWCRRQRLAAAKHLPRRFGGTASQSRPTSATRTPRRPLWPW